MRKNLLLKAIILSILMCSVSIGFPLRNFAAAQTEPEAHLVFNKSVMVKKYKDGDAYVEPHTVKKGEHLWKILRDHYKLSNSSIAFYCMIVKSVNPGIEDINTLEPAQEILIPYRYIKNNKHENVSGIILLPDVDYVINEGEHLAGILRKKYNMPENVIFSQSTYRIFKEANPGISDINKIEKGQRIKIPGLILTGCESIQSDLSTDSQISKASLDLNDEQPRDKTRIKNILSSFTAVFGGTDNQTGEDLISLKGKSSIKIDYDKFPVYEFPWGRKIIFDYGSTMPSGIKEVISSELENAEIVSVSEKDDIESVLDKFVETCAFYKVETRGEYIVNRDNIQVTVSGNWLIFKDDTLKNVFVVNLIDKDDMIAPQLKSYFSSIGLNIIDIDSGMKAQRKEKPLFNNRINYQKVQADPVILTDMILDTLKQKYEKNYNTNIFQNINSGISLQVFADRMFEKGGLKCLIVFNSLPEKICDIISEQRIPLLIITSKDDSPSTVVKKVLDFCGAKYKPSPAEFNYERSNKSLIRISVPGYFMPEESGGVLFTDVSLQEPILKLLSEKNIKIIQY